MVLYIIIYNIRLSEKSSKSWAFSTVWGGASAPPFVMQKINCDTILDLIFDLICILLIKTADIFAVLYFAASQIEYAEISAAKVQSSQFT